MNGPSHLSESLENVYIIYAYHMVHKEVVASFPRCVGGEKQPGINCLHMRDHSQKNLGIRVRQIVGKINMYLSDTI